MKSYRSDLFQKSLGLFSSNVGYGDFFTYVGNRVSLEQAIAVFGLLSPDFIERDDHIFWHPNIETYAPEKFPLVGFRRSASGELEKSYARTDVERYRDNFLVSQLFSKWEDGPDEMASMVDIS